MAGTERARRGDKRRRIIEAAIRVFAKRGFHQARISDIASRAGVADGTIYLYFKNKEDLLLRVFEEKMDGLIRDLDRALESIDDPLDRIRTFAQFHFDQVRSQPELAEVLQIELRMSPKFIRDYRPVRFWSYLDRLGGAIRAGQQAGLIRDHLDPFVARWALFGALDELAMQWVLARKNKRFDLDRAAGDVAELFIRGISTQVNHGGTS